MNNYPKSRHYWWLNVIPKEDEAYGNGWTLSERPVGERECYSLYRDSPHCDSENKRRKRRIFRNFLEAAVGDIVIAYATDSHKRIEAILKVVAEQDGENLYFEKTELLKVPITLAELRNRPEVSHMRYFKSRRGFRIPQGSLYKLSLLEYAAVMDLIREKNP